MHEADRHAAPGEGSRHDAHAIAASRAEEDAEEGLGGVRVVTGGAHEAHGGRVKHGVVHVHLLQGALDERLLLHRPEEPLFDERCGSWMCGEHMVAQ
jgi:hypothetical protein